MNCELIVHYLRLYMNELPVFRAPVDTLKCVPFQLGRLTISSIKNKI